MSTFFWVILVVMLIPLVEGALLALVLREIHVRHPLPLIEPGYINAWYVPKPKTIVTKPVEEQETPNGSVIEDTVDTGDTTEATVGDNVPPPGEVSVFNGAANRPADFLGDVVLDAMTVAIPEAIPDAFEHRIEESTRLKDGLPEEARHIRDDLDLDDLEDLAAALPKSKIDFSQEEIDSETQEPIAPLAKELLGENFDFAALETQAKQSPEEKVLDVREDELGMVQVSSPFLVIDSPQLAEINTSQTVFSTFSDDWIQESFSKIEPMEGDVSVFCFAEESRPMFVRKKAN